MTMPIEQATGLRERLGALADQWDAGAAFAERVGGSPAIDALAGQLRECASMLRAALHQETKP